ncbi:MAG TPA: S53 family peptidase [Steroidobacteraceae bacterium]|nr:S53 family peptidase [Steroidobacteraceae bacterium]
MLNRKIVRIAAVCLASLSACGMLAHASNGGISAQSPLARATDLGPMSQSSAVRITVWLKLHDQAALQRTLAEQQRGTANWLTNAQIAARNAPSANDVAAVSNFLKSRGLAVTDVGPNNLFVRASGTAANVESAFDVTLHRYTLNGETFHASATSPTIPGEIAPLVASIGGISSLGARPNVARAPARGFVKPNVARASDPEGASPRMIPLTAGAKGLFFSAQCFYPPTTQTFSGNGATATYQGLRYGADINNQAIGSLPPCGYQPSDLQTAYNLSPLYRVGLDGTGETIAIVDAYGSTTVQADLATFSQVMGLPPANLTVLGTSTESPFSGDPNAGWADETTLDVEWVHAIAPGANILLVVAPTNSFDDLFAAIAMAAMQPGVVAISNSWSGYESGTDVQLRQSGDQILMLANSRGIAVNFASGDEGNETYDLGYQDVNYPASSPYATAVGGVSVALDRNQHILFQTSWGNNITEVADKASLGNPPIDPPNNEGFVYGGGGGTSNVYRLPSFQRGLGGQRRLVPDVSWVADPYTGVEIVESVDNLGDQSIGVIGGTSLATPMFSALWGIAAQRAGHALGQAAPYLYRLPPGAITDIDGTPDMRSNVSGVIEDSNGTQNLTPWDLALPLQGLPTFVSALYNSPFSTRWFVLTFGTDSTLQTGPGWDPATGVGTPNGWNFVQAFGGEQRGRGEN